ncbi:unnamed protein product [Schistosoma margrebowiei]|uniref:Uncharacterized protein n=1 Tax=Schistosoma margrebowiei TaxID=48269 RepID=A0A183MKB9_9TREM|nr:unnamed protein product [Schistosoma margrebowiei]
MEIRGKMQPHEDNEYTNSQETKNLDENSQSHADEKTENDKVDYLIQAAEERAKRRELDRQNSSENHLLFDALQKPKRNSEYQRGLLNAPWYTNPEEGISSEDVQRYYSKSVKPVLNSLQKISKSKSTTQQDFPKYSLQELKECRQKNYNGNRESLDWPFSETNGSIKKDELEGSHYHRSSAVIGQGFLEKFGPKSPSLNKKLTLASIMNGRFLKLFLSCHNTTKIINLSYLFHAKVNSNFCNILTLS